MIKKLKASATQFLIGIAGVACINLSFAQCSTSADPVSITGTNCPNVVVNNNKTELTVQQGGYVGTTAGSSNPALEILNSSLGTLNNYGLIQGQTQNTAGILLSGNSVITNLNNSSQINGAQYAIKLTDSSRIGTITNAGTIINNGNNAVAQSIFLSTATGSTSINLIQNSGAINGSTGAIYLDTASGTNNASIATINNAGTINGGEDAGILVGTGNRIGVINNQVGAQISAGSCNGLTCYNSIRNWGTISEINNYGIILGTTGYGHIGYGIDNAGTINNLNNAQSNLTFTGQLPVNYSVIIYSANNYGKTTFSNPVGGPITFGISPLSTLPSGTTSYLNVLSGLASPSSIANANNAGTFGGGIVATTWSLVQSGSDWSLTTTVGNPVARDVPKSAAATKLVAAMTSSYNYAAAGSTNPILSNGFTFAAAAQALTPSQVNQLINVHAEGYSSNMTIGLEQMAHITNTVMDRIHAPMASSPTTKVYQDDEGRYDWADAAAVKGTVNNYNNLAGFGYNLYDLIIGSDIKRTKEGGFGVFAGAGGSSMTESQQVTQNFNTTNYYAGLYGALNFDAQFKLSGALGYMNGSTNANRNAPNVGQFTGGNATSSYNTNGVYAAAKLAKAFQLSELTISPFIGASYSQLWMGRANEQGGNDFNFSINPATAYTAVTFVGADFIYPLLKGVNNPLALIGFYKFGYDWYANNNSAHSITAVSPIYGSFTQVGANMGPISNMFGLGLQGNITKDISTRLGVVASANSYGQEFGGGAELRMKF